MYVCICRAISDSEIRDVLDGRCAPCRPGVDGVSAEFAEEIHNICAEGLGYNCGTCADSVKETIDAHFEAQAPARPAPAKTPVAV